MAAAVGTATAVAAVVVVPHKLVDQPVVMTLTPSLSTDASAAAAAAVQTLSFAPIGVEEGETPMGFAIPKHEVGSPLKLKATWLLWSSLCDEYK